MSDEKNNLPVNVDRTSQNVVDKMKSESLSFFNPSAWEGINLMAKVFSNAGALPKELNTIPKVVMALQAGKEANMQPLEALSSFAPINGKMTMYGDALIAQVARAGHTIKWGKCNTEEATVTIKRCDNGTEMTETYTIEDAKRARLNTRDVWMKYTRRMLKYKAFAEVAHFLVADALKGTIIREFADEYIDTEVEVVNKKDKQKKPIELESTKVNAEEITAGSPSGSLDEAINKKDDDVIDEMPEEEPKRLKDDIIKDIASLSLEKKISINEICEKYKKTAIDKFTVKELLTIEDALKKSEVREEMPNKEPNKSQDKPKEKKLSPAMQTMKNAKENKESEMKKEKDIKTIPCDVCEVVNELNAHDPNELTKEQLILINDCHNGDFKGETSPNYKGVF